MDPHPPGGVNSDGGIVPIPGMSCLLDILAAAQQEMKAMMRMDRIDIAKFEAAMRG
jgi:hypothetical protein